MKSNFMKTLKKGICIGMAGAVIITGTPDDLGIHPVMKVEASVADIADAGTLEDAQKKFSEEVLYYISCAETEISFVSDAYTSFYDVYMRMGSNSDNNNRLFEQNHSIFSGVSSVVDDIKGFNSKYKGQNNIMISDAESIINSLTALDLKYTEIYQTVCKVKSELDTGSGSRYDDFEYFARKYSAYLDALSNQISNINLAIHAFSNWGTVSTPTPKPLSFKFVYGFDYNGKAEQVIGSVHYEGDTTWISSYNVPIREGYTFTGWTCNCGSLVYDAVLNGYTYTFGSEDAVLTATWKLDSSYNVPTAAPTVIPTVEPTVAPTVIPTVIPTAEPTVIPTVIPTVEPTVAPTVVPTVIPTVEPTVAPTVVPTVLPTIEPIVTSTVTIQPVVTEKPEPTMKPLSLKFVYGFDFYGRTEQVVDGVNYEGDTTWISKYNVPERTGYIFAGWTCNCGSLVYDAALNGYTYTFGSEDAVLTATWKADPDYKEPTTEPVVTPATEPTNVPQVTTQPTVTKTPVSTTQPVTLKKKTIKIGKGEKVAVPLNGTSKKITYSSKDKKIATVTSKGIVKGVKAGTTTIIVKADGKTCKLKVKVKKKPAKVKISSVSKVNMSIGDRLILQAVLNSGAASYSLTWKSSNKKVVTVNSQGVATIKGKGKATITVKTYNGITAKLNMNIK
ncbi:MAG: hypothetical protein HFJ09_06755 [Lachnospiraceae bacterium]|nr:hypothetical protein [Lachnospiraceae bacterium]